MRLPLFILAVTAMLSFSAAKINPAEKILLVQIDDIGIISVNRDTVSSDILARYIQERLFKSYLGTGKMHNRIQLQKMNENVPDMVTAVIVNEIKEGQKKALIEVSLQKYRRTYDGLEKKQQEKLKKLFPVLFQENFA